MNPFQLFLIVIAIISHAVRAQDGSSALPLCAIACMETHVPASPCSATDQHCICTNEELQTALTACVKADCSVRDSLATQGVTAQTCGWPVRDQQPLLRTTTISLLVVVTLFFITRMTARLPVFGGQFGTDDYMISIAYALTIAFSVIQTRSASAGLGKDIWNISSTHQNDQVTYTLQLFTALEKFYILIVWITKISVLFLYLRIFPDSRFRINVKLCIAFCATTAFCLFFACLFKCWPVSYSWTFWDGEHHGACSSQNAQGWANAGLNIFGDLLVIILPLTTIWRMQLSTSKKFGISIMFGFGIFITVISIVRLNSLKVFNLSTNPTWDFTNLALWSCIEVDIGIICACLPGTRNFYSRVIRGKIQGKGQFAGSSRASSPTSMYRQRHATYPYIRSGSAMSNISEDSQSAIRGAIAMLPKDFILVINDVRVEERSMSPDSLERGVHFSWYGVEK